MMNIYQIIIIILYSMSLGIALVNHGKPKQGNENFWITLISVLINLFILIQGGFF